MPASRVSAPRSGTEPLDDAAFAPAAASRAEPCKNPVTGDGKGQEHRLATVLRNPVPLRTKSFDREIDRRFVAYRIRLPGSHRYAGERLVRNPVWAGAASML